MKAVPSLAEIGLDRVFIALTVALAAVRPALAVCVAVPVYLIHRAVFLTPTLKAAGQFPVNTTTITSEELHCEVTFPCAKEKRFWSRLWPGSALVRIKAMASYANVPLLLLEHLQRVYVEYWSGKCLQEGKPRSGWPLVIFSHGLTGDPYIYTSLRLQLAAQGFVVAAPAHRDGSANVVCLADGKHLYFTRSDEENRLALRKQQLEHRCAEVDQAVILVKETVKQEGNVLFNNVDTSKILLVGHSFGGATALKSASRRTDVGALVTLDCWYEPLIPKPPTLPSSVPHLALLTEHFYTWKPHFEVELDTMKKHKNKASALVVVKDTRHQDQSDMSLFAPNVVFFSNTNRLVAAS